MAGRFLWKHTGGGQVAGGKVNVLFNNYDYNDQYVSGGLYKQDGTLVEQFQLSDRGRPSAELPNPNSATKFFGSKPGAAYGDDLYFQATRASGATERYNIPSGGSRFAGDVGNPDPQFEKDKPMFGGGSGGQFAPGQIGYGFFPAFLGDEFPQFNYNFTDPEEFAAKYGDFSRNELLKNFDIAKDLSLKELDLELESLNKFVPAASALKRSEISIDNLFNQSQRTQQVDSVLPNARGDLRGQRDRATAYAEGRLPDSVEDRVLEGNIRSRAADASTFGGFGARSSVARKASDLMSVEQRLQLSQYGDQLLGTNLDRSANLLLAPTEYSDAGSQIKVNPSISPAALIDKNLGFIHQATSISPSQALTSQIQQEQFQSTSQFNAEAAKFGYLVQYAGTVAGAAQTDSNTQIAIDQQKRAEDIFREQLDKTQSSNTVKDIISGISQVITSVASLAGSSKPSSESGDTPYVPTPDESIPNPATPDVPDAAGGPTAVPPEPGPRVAPEPAPLPETPTSAETAEANNFTQDTGVDTSNVSTKALAKQGSSTLASVGITNTPGPNTRYIGVDNTGQKVYADKALMNSKDYGLGAASVDVLKTVLDPLGVLSSDDSTTLDKIAAVSKDANFIASLTDAYSRGDKKDFINTLLGQFKQPLIESLSDDPRDQAGMGAAYGAYKLFDNWGRMSPGQKALSISTTGIQAFKYATGENLATKVIIDPIKEGGKVVRPGLDVGQALGLMQAGYNIYSLVKNWDQYNTIQKVAAGTGTAANVAEISRQLGLQGSGTTGATVAATSAEIARSGMTSVPQYGVGALSGPAGSQLPRGYVQVATDQSGNVVAVPDGLQSTVPDMLRQAGGVASIALGAQTVYKGWGTGGTKGAVNGALGGSAIVSGMSMLGYSNPYTAAAIIATSVIGNAVKVGKSGNQAARDGVRSVFNKLGLSDKNGVVTLADGSKASIGIDGHGNQRSAFDSSKVQNYKGKKLNAWDVDYTNDLDYAAGMGGIALSRIATGGADKAIDQVGGNIGNASLSNIGYGKEFTPENFNKMAQNQRAMYAKAGIKSKADAFQLANQAFAEGRLNDTQLVAAHQAFNFIFDDNGYASAQSLMAGRWRGVEVAHEEAKLPEAATAPKNNFVFKPLEGPARKFKNFTLTKDQIRAANSAKFQGVNA